MKTSYKSRHVPVFQGLKQSRTGSHLGSQVYFGFQKVKQDLAHSMFHPQISSRFPKVPILQIEETKAQSTSS